MYHSLLTFILNKEHHKYRKDFPEYNDLGESYSKLGLSPKERMTRRFELFAGLETPVLLPNEKIAFIRTVKKLPNCFTKEEMAEFRSKYHLHENGYVSNICPNYEDTIKVGLLARREDADEYGKRIIDAIIDLSDRYKAEAEKQGRHELASVLTRVPRYGATSFYEALQFFRILHYALWLEGDYHNTIGRFDKFMYPYFKADLDSGVHTEESAFKLLCDFFISFNKDSDLYTGVQQGDNGQSMVLGGMDENGNEVFNKLSSMCLRASGELLLIDPKINLRVNKNTPLELYEEGTKLTKAGLGFPQYSNDDIVIDGLVRLGYDLEDARNYVVAACWEFIIPKVGTDFVNCNALSFPKVIDTCLRRDLEACDTFEEFMNAVRGEINAECDKLCSATDNLWVIPSPFMNILIDGGVYEGAKYNNFGFHGSGIATGADSLAAIEKYIYTDKTITKKQMLEAVDSDFEKHPEILPILRYEAPKMGNNDDRSDEKAVELLRVFGECLEGRRNCRGGIYRAGTGTAMCYLWHARDIGASPDGRRKGESLGTNFSASLFAKINGPMSVVQSFTKPDFKKAINGGPLTLEFASSMFAHEDSITKVAMLVKSFIDMGGHQLQLNSVNTKLMEAAQKDPDAHRQLVVRIWGWSAYFVELDKEYQDHVMLRQQYTP